MTAHRWEVEEAGASKTIILKRDGTPVARFYAGRLTIVEQLDIATRLNAMESFADTLKDMEGPRR